MAGIEAKTTTKIMATQSPKLFIFYASCKSRITLEKLLRRCCLLLFNVQEALLILAELFSQSPRRPQEEIQVPCPGLGVRFWVLNRDVVHQMVVVHPPDAFD